MEIFQFLRARVRYLPLLCLGLSLQAFALPWQEPIVISGTVRSTEGEVLAGSNIVIKGTNTGTIADFDGNFEIEVPDRDAILVFSYVGFTPKEVAVGLQTVMEVALEPDLGRLSEVVVIGYGSQRKSDLTGSVSSVSAEELRAVPAPSFEQALQGRAAGVQVTQTSGVPGGGTNIRIRGTSSVNASSEPLYVIDGMLVNSDGNETSIGGRGPGIGPLATINPNDIESIEILKDASATAIYGSRGANGVVLVTTKKGKEGRETISFNAYYGVQEVSRKLDLLNAREYAELVNDAEINAGRNPVYVNPGSLGKGTDWQEELFRAAPIADYQLSFSGGDAKTSYSLSGGLFTQDGIVVGSDFKRYSFRANLERKISDRLKIGNNLSYARIISNGVLTGPGQIVPGVIANALQINPVLTVYNPDEPGGYTFQHDRKDAVANPVAEAREYESKTVTSRLLGNVFAEYSLTENLDFRTSFGIDLLNTKSSTFGPNFLKRTENSRGEASVSTLNALTWLNENTLTYNKTFENGNNLTALLGFTLQEFENESLSAIAFGFPDGRTGYHNLAAAENPQPPVNDESRWALVSYLARVNYALDNKYLFTLSGRVDGSSKFSKGNQYGFFPSGAFAWRVINEDFMKDSELFSDLKLRLSYGVLGNQSIGPYNSLALIAPFGEGVFNNGPGAPEVFYGREPGSFPNRDLKWETTRQANLGLDMAFLNGKLRLTAEVYDKKTSDLLLGTPIPFTTGFQTTLLNVGNVQNRGFGLELGADILTGTFSWNTSGNFSVNRNKVTNLARDEDINLLVAGSILREGHPIGTFEGYVFDGIYQSDEEAASGPALRGQTPVAGDRKYKDLSGPEGTPDGFIDEYDRTIIGTAEPDFTWGLNNEFSYKNFTLNVFIQGSQGNDMVNMNLVNLENLNGQQNVLAKAGRNRWTPENPGNVYPRAAADDSFSSVFSSRFVEDASYVRVKNITLGYNLPQKLMDRIGMSNLRIYASATNLFTWTDYSGYDPEGNAYGGTTNIVGVDDGNYPQTRTYTFGINLGF
ncbi:SusC/RagA family TonB-linked outer membrane protein [Sinomicrobium weinanense]|uniref:TonB-dependent receptor n=1 Tax=Sinomicrobium weinanense TaxID=2842200 RepID=A0A926JTD7_9FLAO|nr:TonB-dependent receptor [Sinomicrobium weinanense]MBC9797026.1 TonB-dependent receptor [Sinomicrobium weinanense]MBU3123276.1 TonB-dependent receptor [Sinomicrobium weinanense]